MIGAQSSDKAMRIVGSYILTYCQGCANKCKFNQADAIKLTYKNNDKYIVFANGYNNNSQDFIQGEKVLP